MEKMKAKNAKLLASSRGPNEDVNWRCNSSLCIPIQGYFRFTGTNKRHTKTSSVAIRKDLDSKRRVEGRDGGHESTAPSSMALLFTLLHSGP